MALPTSTFVTYQAVGNREDLIGHDLPHRPDRYAVHERHRNGEGDRRQSRMADPGARRCLRLRMPSSKATIPTAAATTPTVRLGNLCQITYKFAQVSGTQQAVEHAGRDNEMAYQEMLKGLELKRDMETILFGTNQAKVTGDSTTPRQTASILSWIKSNTSKGSGRLAGRSSAADGTGTRTDGTQIAFTEAG